MNNQKDQIKAAIIGGIFAVLAACIGGIFLIANTFVENGFTVTGPSIQANPETTATNVVVVPLATNTVGSTQRTGNGCSWEFNWELQSDGTYLWTGDTPGTTNCWMVGQSGDLLQRMKNGENLTFVIDVGDIPLPLDICTGTIIPPINSGELCVNPQYDLMPLVSGEITISGSSGNSGGFTIGYDTPVAP